MPSPSRTTVQIPVDAELPVQAQALKINLSRAAEAGWRQAVSVAGADGWLADNAASLDSSNAYVERYGLPLARFRCF
jgi:antitoxin CcdA